MTVINRVRFDSNTSSPFRVSVNGVDESSAEFNTLIFDGNQAPMRLWATGWFTLAGISDNDFNGGKNINVDHTGTFPANTGKEALFITMWKLSDPAANPNGMVTTPYFASRQGGGGGMCSGNFVGANFHVGLAGSGAAPGPSIYTNYCVFKNDN